MPGGRCSHRHEEGAAACLSPCPVEGRCWFIMWGTAVCSVFSSCPGQQVVDVTWGGCCRRQLVVLACARRPVSRVVSSCPVVAVIVTWGDCLPGGEPLSSSACGPWAQCPASRVASSCPAVAVVVTFASPLAWRKSFRHLVGDYCLCLLLLPVEPTQTDLDKAVCLTEQAFSRRGNVVPIIFSDISYPPG